MLLIKKIEIYIYNKILSYDYKNYSGMINSGIVRTFKLRWSWYTFNLLGEKYKKLFANKIW